MARHNQAVLAVLAALALAACGSNGGGSADTGSGTTAAGSGGTRNAPAAQEGGSRSGGASASSASSGSGACRLLGEYGSKGKNEVYRCNLSAVLASAEAKQELSGIRVSAGGGGQLRANGVARSFARDDAASCERAIINGVRKLQNPRNARGTVRSVSNVGSYAAGSNGKFDSGRFAPAGTADCIVATWQSRTVLRGTPHY